jgi:PAS domain S-box-containing protein
MVTVRHPTACGRQTKAATAMGNPALDIGRIHDENAVLRHILEGTATATGEHFFRALVENLAKTIQTHSAWVTEYVPEKRQLHALAFWSNGQVYENFFIDVDGTPCEKVIESTDIVHYPDNVLRLYPQNSTFKEFNARSYLGIPLVDNNGRVLGNLAVFDIRPMPREPQLLVVFKIFAARASAELQRLHAETRLRKSEETFRRIVETTGEGFVLMDKDMIISSANEAFCRMVGHSPSSVVGRSPLDFAAGDFRQFLTVNRKHLFSEQHKEFEGRLRSKSGREIPVRIYGDILKDDLDRVIGYMNFISDLTLQKRSLVLAGEVQRSLMPQSSPHLIGYDIAGRTLSCDEIGGDYFDYWADPDKPQEAITIVVGDVTGHGAEAALLMTTARAIFRMKALQMNDMAEIVNAMNRQLSLDVLDTGRFMTLFCLRLASREGRPQWIRAGHTPALMYLPEADRFEELKGEGLALGVDAAYRYQVHYAPEMADGHIVALGTDGIWETFDRHGKQYGLHGFRSAIRDNAHKPAAAIVDAVYDDLNRFAYGTRREDDISLVIVKAGPGQSAPQDWSI